MRHLVLVGGLRDKNMKKVQQAVHATLRSTDKFLENPGLRSAANLVRSTANFAGSTITAGSRAIQRTSTAANRARRRGRRRARRVRQGLSNAPRNSTRLALPAATGDLIEAPVAFGLQQSANHNYFVDMVRDDGTHVRRAFGHETLDILQNATPGTAYNYTSQSYYVNPTKLGLAWLAKTSAGYQKFSFNRMKLDFLPSVATSMAGQVAMIWSRDPSIAMPDDFESLRRLPNSTVANAWVPSQMDAVIPTADYFMLPPLTGSTDNRLMNQGNVHILTQGVPTSGTPSVPVGQKIGSIVVHYECDLIDLAAVEPELSDFSAYGDYFPSTSVVSDLLSSIRVPPFWERDGRVFTYYGPRKTCRIVMFALSSADETVPNGVTLTIVDRCGIAVETNTIAEHSGYASGGSNISRRFKVVEFTMPKGGVITFGTTFASLSGGISLYCALDM